MMRLSVLALPLVASVSTSQVLAHPTGFKHSHVHDSDSFWDDHHAVKGKPKDEEPCDDDDDVGGTQHIVHFMRAAKKTGYSVYYKYFGDYHGSKNTKSKDAVIYGSSKSSDSSAETTVDQDVYASNNSTATENGSNLGVGYDAGTKHATSYGVSGDAFIGGEYSSDKDELTIGEEEEDDDRRRLSMRGSKKSKKYPKKKEEPDVEITEKDNTYSGYLGGDLKGSYKQSMSDGKKGDVGGYHSSYGPNTYDSNNVYDDQLDQFHSQSSDAHKGDYSSDKDVHKDEQVLDLDFEVQGADGGKKGDGSSIGFLDKLTSLM